MNFIHSMTGFGRSEIINEDYRIVAEIKSVNHRYLDLSVRMPRRFNIFESDIRKLVKSYTERGKIELYLSSENYSLKDTRIIYNRELAKEYVRCIDDISEDFGLDDRLSAYEVAGFPDVLIVEEPAEDRRLWDELEKLLKEALQNLVEERRREGQHLREDLLLKLDAMSERVESIEQISPHIVEAYHTRLLAKLKETLASLDLTADESRIVTEVAVFADRVCTDEEIVRLKSHIQAVRKKLEDGGSCGRELDFIAQEMMRETNTILSKSNNLDKSNMAISLKAEIEKLREQVQNIE